MPKPYSPQLPKPKTIAEEGLVLDFNAGASGLQSRAELAALIMEYIALISKLDYKLECATLIAIGGGQHVAEAFLSGMTPFEHGHRRSAIQGVLKAKGGLTGKEVEELFSGIKNARDLRNDFAHGLWFVPNDVPETLVLTKTYNELLRFGLMLDTHRAQSIREPLMEFALEMTFDGGTLPNGFAEKLSKLFSQLRSPWDDAFSQQAMAASEHEAEERADWFAQNPCENIDWSKLVRSGEKLPLAKSELLAMGSGVHADATIWNAESLTQAITYAIYASDKAQVLIDKLSSVREHSAQNSGI